MKASILELKSPSLTASNLAIVLSFMLSGCANLGVGSEEYSCSGLPQGVSCQSARNIYLNRHTLKLQSELKNKLSMAEVEEVSEVKDFGNADHKSHIDSTHQNLGGSIGYSNQNDNPFGVRGIEIKRSPADVAIIVFNTYRDHQSFVHERPIMYVDIGNSHWERGGNVVKHSQSTSSDAVLPRL